MTKDNLLKLGEIIVDAYVAGKINQAQEIDMLNHCNDCLIGDMVKDEEKIKRRKIMREVKRDILL